MWTHKKTTTSSLILKVIHTAARGKSALLLVASCTHFYLAAYSTCLLFFTCSKGSFPLIPLLFSLPFSLVLFVSTSFFFLPFFFLPLSPHLLCVCLFFTPLSSLHPSVFSFLHLFNFILPCATAFFFYWIHSPFTIF